jgi:predicted RNA binding protein YcfA (HicA-like mRNA interferase family)
MSTFPSSKAKQVLAALIKIGWSVKRQTGSHKVLQREGYDCLSLPFIKAKK